VKKAKFQFMDAHKDRWGVSAMCRVLEVTRQGYYQWTVRPISAHDERDFEISCAMVPLWEKPDSSATAPRRWCSSCAGWASVRRGGGWRA